MTLAGALLALGLLAAVAALPTQDPVIRKLDPGARYQYVHGPDGTPHLVDLWLKASDLNEAARYNPDVDNIYHLFTRQNPTVSQPLLLSSNFLLDQSNYDGSKRTIILVHGWMGGPSSNLNALLVPAFLSVEDVNVIVVDWRAGGGTINYAVAVINAPTSGASVGRFINWLNLVRGPGATSYHLIGHSLGGQQVGIIGRNVLGDVGYITAVDPAGPGWYTNSHRFREDDGRYTEVIHTNVGVLGFLTPIGQVSFYPNGGINMPGCNSQQCDHDRGFFYLEESIRSGGFTGQRCETWQDALSGNCHLPGPLHLGGIDPKTGSTGIFHLITNAGPPFSQG